MKRPAELIEDFFMSVKTDYSIDECKYDTFQYFNKLENYKRVYTLNEREIALCYAFGIFYAKINVDDIVYIDFIKLLGKLEDILNDKNIKSVYSVMNIFNTNIPNFVNDSPQSIIDKCSEYEAPISWDEYFMELARTAAKRSKDPKCKVGACIMDPKDNRVVSLGYNGFPYGCSDKEFPWDKEGDDNKYLYVVHAEANAILSARRDLTGCRLYCTYEPCNECMKMIIQSGIKEVVYDRDCSHPESQANIAMLKMTRAAKISMVKYTGG